MNSASDLADLTLVEVAEAIRTKSVSALEVAKASVRRLRFAAENFHCAVRFDEDTILADARRADGDLARGKLRGPLHGVPLAHKDMFFRAGRISGCGSRILEAYQPSYTATVLQRLDSAGALDIARLHMAEFALGATGHNDAIGHAMNPWNAACAPGGSSSGSAIAVAARAVYGSLGTDTGGSVRQPSAFCGVVGLKPSTGRISRHGVMPLSHTLDTVGCISRSVAECALLYEIIAGRDACDASTVDREMTSVDLAENQSLADIKIGVPRDFFFDALDGDVASSMDRALDVFRKLGAELIPIDVPSAGSISSLLAIIVGVESAALHRRWLQERPQDYGAQTLSRLHLGLFYPGTSYVEALTLRAQLLAEINDAVFAKVDVIATPTMPLVAPDIVLSDVGTADGYSDYLARFARCTRLASYLGLPALSVPAGLSANGLPCALQLVGKMFDEATILRVGASYERETGPLGMPTACLAMREDPLVADKRKYS
jgi:aspartyl-tRNA(Asn)/glutamyl-tRNA(Gln) amidotransferase subunit A